MERHIATSRLNLQRCAGDNSDLGVVIESGNRPEIMTTFLITHEIGAYRLLPADDGGGKQVGFHFAHEGH